MNLHQFSRYVCIHLTESQNNCITSASFLEYIKAAPKSVKYALPETLSIKMLCAYTSPCDINLLWQCFNAVAMSTTTWVMKGRVQEKSFKLYRHLSILMLSMGFIPRGREFGTLLMIKPWRPSTSNSPKTLGIMLALSSESDVLNRLNIFISSSALPSGLIPSSPVDQNFIAIKAGI